MNFIGQVTYNPGHFILETASLQFQLACRFIIDFFVLFCFVFFFLVSPLHYLLVLVIIQYKLLSPKTKTPYCNIACLLGLDIYRQLISVCEWLLFFPGQMNL